MATIVLEVGEEFEHYHSVPSSTQLVEGGIAIWIDGKLTKIPKGQAIDIPPKTSHNIQNIGESRAILCLRRVSASGLCV